jgi:hypothetical protein
MIFAAGVDSEGVAPQLWYVLGLADAKHLSMTGHQLTVTSMRRANDTTISGHHPPDGMLVRAADVSRLHFPDLSAVRLFQSNLGQLLYPYVVVLVEPEDITPEEYRALGITTTPAPHVHIQLQGYQWPSLK